MRIHTLAEKHDDAHQDAKSLRLIGNAYFYMKRYNDALSWYLQAMDKAKDIDDVALKGDITNNIGHLYYRLREWQKALDYLESALEMHRLENDTLKTARTLSNLGNTWWQLHDFERARRYYSQVVDLLKHDRFGSDYALNLNNLGNAWFKVGDYVEALKCYTEALEIKERDGNAKEIANALTNLGNFYWRSERWEEAEENYHKAFSIFEEEGDTLRMAGVYSNLGIIHDELEDYKEAFKNHESSLRLYRMIDNDAGIARTLNNIGNVYRKIDQPQNAIRCYLESLEIKKRLGDYEGIVASQLNLAGMYREFKQYDTALEYASEALSGAEEFNLLEERKNTLFLISDIHETQGDFRESLRFFKEYYTLVDSLYNKENRTKVSEIRIRYETEQKEKAIELLEKDRELQQMQIQKEHREKILFFAIAIIILVVSAVFLLLYRFARREALNRKKIQAELEELNHTLEEKIDEALRKQREQQQILIQRSKLESLGKLAAGIAHEINQPLSGISLGLDNILGRTEPDREYIRAKCDALFEDIERIRQIIEHVRVFSRDQKSIVFDRLDVNAVIRDALSMMQVQLTNRNIDVACRLDENPGYTIGNRYKLEQVVLNLISNARDAVEDRALSADAGYRKKIAIETVADGETIRIVVEDNGIGIRESEIGSIFDPFYTSKAPDKGTGLGLSICYGIVREMNGDISVESRSDDFTRFTITLPRYRDEVDDEQDSNPDSGR